MKCFKIESIEYGWFEYRIGNHYLEASDYLGYDIAKEFLIKLIKVLKKSSEEWMYIMNEPRATLLEFIPVEDTISICAYSMNKPSYDLSSNIEEEIKNIGECEFSIGIAKSEFVDAVVTEYSLYENGNGRNCYELNWGDYPQNEYNELKKIAFEINKNMGKYDSLKCADFLKI